MVDLQEILPVDPAAIHWAVCVFFVFVSLCLGNGMVSMAEKDDRHRRRVERWRTENVGHRFRDLFDFCQHKFTGASDPKCNTSIFTVLQYQKDCS